MANSGSVYTHIIQGWALICPGRSGEQKQAALKHTDRAEFQRQKILGSLVSSLSDIDGAAGVLKEHWRYLNLLLMSDILQAF